MSDNSHSTPRGRGSFNTLAQNGTKQSDKPVAILVGKGSELSEKQTLKGRAKRKVITQAMVLGLIDANNNKGLTGDWRKSYCPLCLRDRPRTGPL